MKNWIRRHSRRFTTYSPSATSQSPGAIQRGTFVSASPSQSASQSPSQSPSASPSPSPEIPDEVPPDRPAERVRFKIIRDAEDDTVV